MANAQLVNQLHAITEQRNELAKDKEDWLTEKMDLEIQVHKWEGRHRDSIQLGLANQNSAFGDFTKRMNEERRKGQASSAIIKDQDAMIRVLTTHAHEKKGRKQAL